MQAEKFGTWESAVSWLLANPDHIDLCQSCYYDRPALGAARRYLASAEWQALRAFMPKRDGAALDVGAGMGIAAFALASDGWETHALEPDVSELVGAGAIRRLAAEGNVKISVVQEWGESLPFSDGRFQLVHARQVLHHARELPKFCQELFRVLVPGGVLLATREHVISGPAQLPKFLAKHPLHKYYGGENAYTLNTYLQALRAAGFTITKTLGPLESVINYAPFTEDSLCQAIAGQASRIPGGKLLANIALAPLWRKAMLPLLSKLDRRPGRLYTFVATKP